jgi:hypothetical protein
VKKQPIKNKITKDPKTKKVSVTIAKKRHKPKYGISKLETDFARDFLDKLGLKYIYEYEARDIKRFYDFAIVQYQEVQYIMENKHGIDCVKQDGQNVNIGLMIEIDGGYW